MKLQQYLRVILGGEILLWSFCLLRAQEYPTQGEDYYIIEYYLQYKPKPIEEIKSAIEGYTLVQGKLFNILQGFQKSVYRLPGQGQPISPPPPPPAGKPSGPNRLDDNRLEKMSPPFPGSPLAPKQPPESGVLNELSIYLDLNQARVHDEILQGSGTDRCIALTLEYPVWRDLSFGVTYSYNRYKIKGVSTHLQYTHSLDFLASYLLNDYVGFGGFINVSWIDIEESLHFNPVTLSMEDLSDRFGAWGGGLLLSLNYQWTHFTNIGVTTSLASMNKDSLAKLGNDRDTAWLNSVNLLHYLTDYLALSAYSTFYCLIDREPEQPDGSFFILGLELQYRLTPLTSLGIGFETTAADHDRDEKRYLLGISTRF